MAAMTLHSDRSRRIIIIIVSIQLDLLLLMCLDSVMGRALNSRPRGRARVYSAVN